MGEGLKPVPSKGHAVITSYIVILIRVCSKHRADFICTYKRRQAAGSQVEVTSRELETMKNSTKIHLACLFLVSFVLLCEIKFSAAFASYDFGNGKLYKLDADKDVWLEGNSNKNSYSMLLVGKHTGYPKKRLIVRFEMSNLPSSCTNILWAKMYLYYFTVSLTGQSFSQVPYISRQLQVRRIKQSWTENQATSVVRHTNIHWCGFYLNLNGCDADPFVQDTVTIYTNRPYGYLEFTVTQAAQLWKNGVANHGLVVSALNENTNGRDHRFYSREHPNPAVRPFMHVLCSY